MGGMGHRNGSYAEFVSAAAGNVVALDTSLDWTDPAALPEVYATAWSAARQPRAARPARSPADPRRHLGARPGRAEHRRRPARDGHRHEPRPRLRRTGRALGATQTLTDDGALAPQVPRRAGRPRARPAATASLRDSLACAPRRPPLPGRLPRRACAGRGLQPDRRPSASRTVSSAASLHAATASRSTTSRRRAGLIASPPSAAATALRACSASARGPRTRTA